MTLRGHASQAAAILFVALALGCARLTITRVATFPEKPADCAIAWLKIDRTAASKQYAEVGTLLFVRPSSKYELNDDIRGQTRENACRLGGDAVTYDGKTVLQDSMGGLSTGFTFSVWRNRKSPGK